eukprot:6478681-Amphidinium_carterae.1
MEYLEFAWELLLDVLLLWGAWSRGYPLCSLWRSWQDCPHLRCQSMLFLVEELTGSWRTNVAVQAIATNKSEHSKMQLTERATKHVPSGVSQHAPKNVGSRI